MCIVKRQVICIIYLYIYLYLDGMYQLSISGIITVQNLLHASRYSNPDDNVCLWYLNTV